MKFSEKRTLEKRKKFEKELRTELSKWGSAQLKTATANFIPYLNGEGTPEHFVKFILASKFGEANSYVAIGAWKEFVVDNAKDGCWTNLGEVKTYAQDKLEIAGAKIDRNGGNLWVWDNQGATFEINVAGFRATNGQCVGSVQFSIGRVNETSGIMGIQVVSRFLASVTAPNFNTLALDYLRGAVEEWEDRQ